ncbi:MAG: phosphatidylglycerophosphatase A [Methylophilaceae bacterium]|jgi:phosphatidylglycerophosphatase A|uniref:phosphatidylglycerophosphatase A family protein n=1 Tax=Methylobacillus sp. MM3 TaxID=1848039 RepID=UPI0009EE7F88|nr:phosphatidylglycerophosphatase A [Methylobacillus sp. MM3]
MTTLPDRRFLLQHPAHLLALGFGSGLARIAPGTLGTVVAFPLFYGMMALPTAFHLPLIALLFVAGIPICARTSQALGVEDHGGIVWDEIVAMLLVLEFTPRTWPWWLAAFVLFRLFDIWKPFPIRLCDTRLKGGFGVMFDDLLAAIYTLLTLYALQWLTIHL